MIDFSLIYQSLPSLLHGASLSLQIAVMAAAIGLVLGVPLAFCEQSKSLSVRAFTWAYVNLFRGTPMLVQILFVYYVLPQFDVMIPPYWAATLAIGLNSSAYISEIVRGGISAVPFGQIEAAQTLGMSPYATKRYIVFPQAFRVAIPALGNELVTLVKDSSLASIIGVMELSKEGSVIRSRTYDAFSVLLAVSCIYLVMTSLISFGVRLYEKRMKKLCSQ